VITLRPYQQEALMAIHQAEREGVRRPLVVHPTGTGKTVAFSAAIKERSSLGKSLVLVHREELASQTIESLSWIAPELSTGLVKAKHNEVNRDIVVASIDTVHRDNRLSQLGEFATVVVDEAHHAVAPIYMKTLTALGSFSPYGPLTVGFTATPERDGKALGVWEKVVSYMSIREAIYGGYLCPILPAQTVETTMNLDRVKKSGGDFSKGSLGDAMEATGVIDQIADAYVTYASDRKGVAFTPTVKTAQHLAEALSARGIAAEAVYGDMPTDDRKAVLARLKTGETQVVTNCAVLTEGFDEPSIDCVVVARPTKFHGLYVQMVGRGTRLHPGKKDLLVLDVTGASERHELVSLVDLDLGLEADDAKRKREDSEEQTCPTCGVPMSQCEYPNHRCRLCTRPLPKRLVAAGELQHETCAVKASKTVDVFGASRLRWLPVESGWCLGAGREVVVMVPNGVDTWKLAAYNAGKLTVLHEQLPVDWAQGIGEDRAKAFKSLAERKARWLTAPPTDQQLSRLVREGLPSNKVQLIRTRGDAADLITRIQARRAVRKLTV
jgi:superfamily II DNA or RNA helicase